MTITALPCTYRGTQFRSRLEADWAATLDHAGITWIYEPEGYKLPSGRCYSPDFWLPKIRTWLEVKGSHNLGLDLTIEFDDALWRDSVCTSRADPDAPIVLVGRDPGVNPINDKHDWMRVQGAKYSAWFVRCQQCQAVTVFVPGSRTRRSCRFTSDDYCDFTEWHTTSIRLPRPAGRRR